MRLWIGATPNPSKTMPSCPKLYLNSVKIILRNSWQFPVWFPNIKVNQTLSWMNQKISLYQKIIVVSIHLLWASCQIKKIWPLLIKILKVNLRLTSEILINQSKKNYLKQTETSEWLQVLKGYQKCFRPQTQRKY